ncbi:hypothetical protein, partial [Tabrizicola sp.]|uniref:hypothetical protein n=1 Tax=Tabrizicola sp. TaxID=2005166 RepID=UPI003F34536E
AFPASSAVFGCRTGGAALTNQIALVLILVILAAIGLDLLANDGVALMFLGRKFLDLVDWVVFWR